ncbi:hypothetical protein FRC09_004764, partial [Ceratobasidium sp. 395]
QNPDVYARNLPTQFENLIVRPLQEVENSIPTGLVIVIDALDECDSNDGVSRMLDILLSRAVELPIRFFVASRPEPEIYDRMLNRKGLRTRFELHLHELEKSIVQEDIKTYLRANLMPANLPGSDIDRLAESSGALFIHAATAVRYILGDNGLKSVKRLEMILDTSNSSSNVHKQIDALYMVILRGAFDDADLDEWDKQEMRLVLYTVICAQEPLTVGVLASLLGSNALDAVHVVLRHMLSVLSFHGVNGRVTTLHQSFPDYMLDSSRSLGYHCNAKEHNSMMTQRCFDLMKVPNPPFNICNLESSFLLDREVPNLDKEIEEAVSNELFYACRYWGAHLLAAEAAKSLVDELHVWACERFLLWLEVMNLKQCLPAGTGMLSRTESWLKRGGHATDTWTLVQDAYMFTIAFMSSPMLDSTPHIYISVLAFWPHQRPIAKSYRPKTRGLVETTGVQQLEQKPEALATCRAPSNVTCIAVSPSGTTIATGCDDGKIHIWDVHTSQITGKALIGHTRAVSSVAYSPDGTRIASGSWDKTIRIWDIQTRTTIGSPFEGHWKIISSIAYSPNGAYILSGSCDHSIRLWDVDTGRMAIKLLRNHYDNVKAVTYAPNAALFASASSDYTVCIWDAHTGAIKGQPLAGHTDSVNSVAFSPDSTRIISGSSDWTIRIWDVHSGKQTGKPLRGHTDKVCSVAYAPSGKFVISGSSDNTVRIWDLQARKATDIPLSDHIYSFPSVSVAFALQGTRIISSADRTLRIWDMHASSANLTSSWFTDLTGEYGFYTLVAVNRLRRSVNHSSQEHHTGRITSVAYSHDGTFIASGSEDHTVRIWDSETGNMIGKPLKGHSDVVKAVACAPNGSQIVSGSQDKTLCIWDPDTGKAIKGPLKGHTGPVLSLAYSPDGERIASGSGDGTILIWDAYTGQVVRGPLKGHTDGVIRTWNTQSGQLINRGVGHSDKVSTVVWSYNSAQIASGSNEGVILIWDANTLDIIGKLMAPDPRYAWVGVNSISFSPRSERIASGCSDSTIRVWESPRVQKVEIPPSTAILGDPGSNNPYEGEDKDGDDVIARSDCRDSIPTADHSALEPGLSASDDWAVVDIDHNPVDRHPLNSWDLDEDGWVVANISDRLVWIPEEIRSTLQPSQVIMMIPQGRWVKLDFSQALVGKQWSSCYRT